MVNYEALGFFVTKTFLLDGNTGVQLAVTNPKQRMDKKERLNGYIYIMILVVNCYWEGATPKKYLKISRFSGPTARCHSLLRMLGPEISLP